MPYMYIYAFQVCWLNVMDLMQCLNCMRDDNDACSTDARRAFQQNIDFPNLMNLNWLDNNNNKVSAPVDVTHVFRNALQVVGLDRDM